MRVLVLLFILISSHAHGQRTESSEKRFFTFHSCEQEQVRFCPATKSWGDINGCLMNHRKDLSKPCQQEIDRLILFRGQATSRGGGALSSFGGLNAIGPPIPLLGFSSRYSPGINSPILLENSFNISAPVSKGPTSSVSASLAAKDLHLGAPVSLGSGTTLAMDWYRMEIGAGYNEQLSDMRTWGLRASAGYAGDVPFNSVSDTTFSLSSYYGFPSSGNGFWLLSVYFSDNSPLGNYIPIPGFDYVYKSENFSGIFGFPVTALEWTPSYPWLISFGFFGPTVQTEVGYGSLENLQVFAGYYWTRESYIPAVRSNSLYRLTVQEMKAALGLRRTIGSQLLAEFLIGEAFSRSLSIGSGLFNSDGGSANLNNDLAASVSLKAKF